jgi:hypothetical protein
VTDRPVPLDHSENASGRRHIPFLAILVLGGAWCSPALGATASTAACDPTADLLRSLDVPVSDLSANVVGHITVEPGNANDESLNASTAPILYLAPRVAVILQNVFSAVAIETPPLDSRDSTQSFATESLSQDESPLSPVAGDASQSDSSELIDPASAGAEVEAIPHFQRQMFRTDI